jgi:hypothetical protein
MPQDESFDRTSENTSCTEEDELPVIHKLCTLPKTTNKSSSSTNQEATILTSSQHIESKLNIRNLKKQTEAPSTKIVPRTTQTAI